INRNPDREAKATLTAGKTPGTTDVILDVETHFPFHPTFNYNREGSYNTGKDCFGYGFRDNNFLGLDDTLMCGQTLSKSSSSYYAYHYVPISNQGTSFLYGLSRASAFPRKDFASYDLRSFSDSASFFIHQDLYDLDNYRGEFYFGLDGKDKYITSNQGLVNKDRLRILRFGARGIYKTRESVIYIQPEFSQGLNLFGAERKNEYSSRQAENTFNKFNLSFAYRRKLTPFLQFSEKNNLQIAFERLTPQEELALGGLDSVRGYAYGDYYADSGIQTSAELLFQPIFLPKEVRLWKSKTPLSEDVTGVLFFDHGFGYRRGKMENENWARKMASCGAGFRVKLYDMIYVRFEWGFVLPMGNPGFSESSPSRLHFSIEFEDKTLDYFAKKLRF
ncbi:MAG: ShlB/FhaC/HecB family hemolysin secretion/activation protein, partial [Candidatus Omnitrophica bacterium]|nr:ShlB/FhaC/HecB family hemolysin secretion/activation protein [Candidatus Omnitrophota bacterium]